jgi:ribosomal protein S19E (S16A)
MQKDIHSSDPLTLAGVQRLEHAGLVRRVPTGGGEVIEVTTLGKQLLEAVASSVA